jgi:predicted kinase
MGNGKRCLANDVGQLCGAVREQAVAIRQQEIARPLHSKLESQLMQGLEKQRLARRMTAKALP